MALFGNFSDIPILDLISLIGANTGTLTIYSSCEQYTYLLGIDHGTITRVQFNGQDVLNSEQALSFIAELVQANAGEFEFQRGDPVGGPHSFPINQVLLSSLAMIDEIQAFRPHFPEPETVFITNASSEIWIGSELSNGWHSTYYYFERGVNALDIQQFMGLNLDHVLLNFYKLRVRGLIVPKRVFNQPNLDIPQKSLVGNEEVNSNLEYATMTCAGEDVVELAVLVDSLKPIWEEPQPDIGIDIQAHSEQMPTAKEKEPNAALHNVKLDRREKSVLKKLMKSIWNMMSTK